jgi:hypothetical protein
LTWTAHLRRIYEDPMIGTSAELTLAGEGEEPVALACIDKTQGVEVWLQGAQTSTVRPAVVTLMDELNELELEPADLENARIEVNGGAWIVKSYYLRPSPLGQDDGEIYLVLTAADA